MNLRTPKATTTSIALLLVMLTAFMLTEIVPPTFGTSFVEATIKGPSTLTTPVVASPTDFLFANGNNFASETWSEAAAEFLGPPGVNPIVIQNVTGVTVQNPIINPALSLTFPQTVAAGDWVVVTTELICNGTKGPFTFSIGGDDSFTLAQDSGNTYLNSTKSAIYYATTSTSTPTITISVTGCAAKGEVTGVIMDVRNLASLGNTVAEDCYSTPLCFGESGQTFDLYFKGNSLIVGTAAITVGVPYCACNGGFVTLQFENSITMYSAPIPQVLYPPYTMTSPNNYGCFADNQDWVFYPDLTGNSGQYVSSNDTNTWTSPTATINTFTPIFTICQGNQVYLFGSSGHCPETAQACFEEGAIVAPGILSFTHEIQYTEIQASSQPLAFAVDAQGTPWFAAWEGRGVNTLFIDGAGVTYFKDNIATEPVVSIAAMSNGETALLYSNSSKLYGTLVGNPPGQKTVNLPTIPFTGGHGGNFTATAEDGTIILAWVDQTSGSIRDMTIQPDSCWSGPCSWSSVSTLASNNDPGQLTSLTATTVGGAAILFYSYRTNTGQPYPDSVGLLYTEDFGATWGTTALSTTEVPSPLGMPISTYPTTVVGTRTQQISLVWCEGTSNAVYRETVPYVTPFYGLQASSCTLREARISLTPFDILTVTSTITSTGPTLTTTATSTTTIAGGGAVLTSTQTRTNLVVETQTKQVNIIVNNKTVIQGVGGLGAGVLGAGACFVLGGPVGAVACGLLGLFGFIGFAGAFPNIALLLGLALIFIDLAVVPTVLKKRATGR